jgi:hypothetical protein
LAANTCGRVVIGASDRLEKLSRASQVQRNAQLAFLYLAGYVPLILQASVTSVKVQKPTNVKLSAMSN